jgi:Raf kinase inhibitor-like YbhB/YbcL family protein
MAVAVVLVVIVAIGLYVVLGKNGPADVTAYLEQRGTIQLTSTAFAEGDSIPAQYTCEAESVVSPPLRILNVPADAKTLALIVDDPDVPKQRVPSGIFTHWVLFNIPATTTEIAEGRQAGVPGANGAGQAAYAGPCPPKEYTPTEHRYFFTVYALDSELGLSQGATKEQVLSAMQGHIVGQSHLMGRYQKTK